jgi:NADH dehydrogenase [ubiquinone] 1 alpha subcomplex assembly factor 7
VKEGADEKGFRNHQIVDIFDLPGSSDLTANVDFQYLSESLADTGSHSLGPMPQARFLLSLGLEPRMAKLLASAPEGRQVDIKKGATRLIDTLGMGSQYQVMGIEPGEGLKAEVYPFPADTPSVGEVQEDGAKEGEPVSSSS